MSKLIQQNAKGNKNELNFLKVADFAQKRKQDRSEGGLLT